MNQDHDERLEQARKLISKRYHEPLKLEDIANEFFLSPFHFHRLYRSRFNETPLMTISRVRLEESKRLLREGKLSVGEICVEVGYSSQTTFSRMFLSATGYSPTAFRHVGQTQQDWREVEGSAPDTIYSGMKANLSHATLFVKDQSSALDFYVKNLASKSAVTLRFPRAFDG